VARLGILGGTFNPPHVGHLVCAQEAVDRLGLDAVLLMPVNSPPHKEIEADPGVEHRLAMCRAAIDGDARLRVSLCELERPGPSFTVDTLRVLHAEHPEDELTWIMGGDMAHSLLTWKEPDAILSLARLGVAEREEVRREHILEALISLPGVPERVEFFDMPRIDLSSSRLRGRVHEGRPIRYLVPDAVRAHIEQEGLYR
jgi:nicotinate-nucleotide adenylyltransferase